MTKTRKNKSDSTRNIFGIGETVLDIIFKDGSPQSARPGGSVLNAMVSLGRTGFPVSFISDYDIGDVGSYIDHFLKENGVDTAFVNRYKKGNTTLALAFLNKKNDASYTFYKDYVPREKNSSIPVVNKGDILLCGSFYSIWPEGRERFTTVALRAMTNRAMIIYDPNFRGTHISDLQTVKPLIMENMQIANLVRGSDEDFNNIFRAQNADDAYEAVKQFCPVMVYTANTKGVFVRTPGFSGRFPVRKIDPVSTVGAGDSFNAGLIASIYKNEFEPDHLVKLAEKEWSEIISHAVDFATDACLSYDNYISSAFASKYFSASKDQI